MLSRKARYGVVFAVIVVLLAVLFVRMPTGYLPDEDQGMLMSMVSLPVGSTLEQTQAVISQVQGYFKEHEKEAVDSFGGVAGFGTAGRGQSEAFAYIKLKDWDLRGSARLRAKAVARRAMLALSRIKEATIYVVPPPAVTELGQRDGLRFLCSRTWAGWATTS